MATTTAAPGMMIGRLWAARAQYASADAKLALLAGAMSRAPRRFADLARLHDALLFLRAFPDDRRVHDAAGAALHAFRQVMRPGRFRERACETGMAGTVTRDVCAFPIAEWLHASYGDAVEINWAEVGDTSGIDDLLRFALQRAEEDAFDSGEISTRRWLALRRGTSGQTALGWLLHAAPRRSAARAAFALMYDAAEIPVRWSLGDSSGSITRNELPAAPLVFRSSMRPAPRDPARFVASRTDAITLCTPGRAREVIHAARAALAARGREVYAMVYANDREVWLADLGEGAQLAVIGVQPAHRMSLESNYGYVMFSNGVPIGYGGVTPLYRQANTGLNIFPSFRGSEAAYLWLATLRAFHSLFGVRRFVVNAYQFGAGNREAIASGAFWFYYRLGFRPADPAVRARAAREFARLRRGGRRSSAAMLTRLAAGDLWLDLRGFRDRDFFDERWLVDCSRLATEALAATGERTPARSARAVIRSAAQALHSARRTKWTADERQAFERLAPVCALLPGTARWSADARAETARLLRTKGRPQEREFVIAAQRNRRFYPGLIRLLSG